MTVGAFYRHRQGDLCRVLRVYGGEVWLVDAHGIRREPRESFERDWEQTQ